MNYESAVFALSTFLIFASVFAGIVYCLILVKELWQKHRGGKNERTNQRAC
jgi:hypothetical protein